MEARHNLLQEVLRESAQYRHVQSSGRSAASSQTAHKLWRI